MNKLYYILYRGLDDKFSSRVFIPELQKLAWNESHPNQNPSRLSWFILMDEEEDCMNSYELAECIY